MPMNIRPTQGQHKAIIDGPMNLAHGDFTTASGTPVNVLPAIAGKQIFVRSMLISFANSGIIRFQESSSGERLFNHEFKDVDQPTTALQPPNGLFFLQEGEGLDMIHFAGGDVRIHITYTYLPGA